MKRNKFLRLLGLGAGTIAAVPLIPETAIENTSADWIDFDDENTIRIWIGSDYINRSNAPFKVDEITLKALTNEQN